MLLAFMLIFMLVIFFVEGIILQRTSNIIADKVKKTNIQNLRQAKQIIDFSMEKIEKTSYNIANDFHLQRDYEALSTEERFYMGSQFFDSFFLDEYIESIYIYYQDSQKVVTTNNGILDVRLLQDLEWLSFYNQQKPFGYRTEFYFRSLEGQNETGSMSFMRGFPYGGKKELGTVVININKSRFFEALQAQDNEHEEMLIFNESGALLYGDSLFYEKLSESEGFVEAVRSKEEYVTVEVEGKETQIALAYSDVKNWVYIKAQDVSLLNKEVEENLQYINLITFACLAVGILLIVVRLNKLYRPVLGLIEIAENNHDKIGTPNKDVARDEIEHLKMLLESIILSRDDMRDFYAKSQNAVLQKTLLDLCYGDIDDAEDIFQYIKDADFPIEGREFVAIVIQFEKSNDGYANSIKRDVISNHTSVEHDLIVTCMQQNKIVCLISIKPGLEHKIYTIASEIKTLIKYEFDVDSTIGIGNAYTDLMQFHISFNEALDALKYKPFLDNDSIIHINSFIGKNEEKYYYSTLKEEELIDAIKHLDKEGALRIIDDIYKSIISSSDSVKTVSLLLWQLTNSIVRCITSMGILYTDVMGATFYQDLTEYNEIDDIATMLAFVKNKVKLVIENLKEKRNYHNENVINRIKDYIDEHLAEELSLEVFASMLMLSSTYISSLFKSFSGEGLRDYVIRKRMEKAKVLLKESNKTIEFISKSVGYENVRSFVRAFKTFSGMTPTEYRKDSSL